MRKLLEHPLTRGLDLDSPETTELRMQIIRSKPFLRKIYEEWYRYLIEGIPDSSGLAIELGSGGGFLGQESQEITTSDVFWLPNLRLVFDAQRMPFKDSSLKSLMMVNVLHHIPNAELFFGEAVRCLEAGGSIAMIEPWVNGWSRWVYENLHHEPFDPEASKWQFPASGPLSGANGALPWMILVRDAERFKALFPQLETLSINPIMPLRYLVSGGVSMRSLMPGWSFGAWKLIEKVLGLAFPRAGLFAVVRMRKV